MEKTGVHNHTTITVCIEDFLQHLQSLKYSSKSIKTYRISLDKFQSYLLKNRIDRIQDVTLKDLDQYRLFLVDTGLSDASLAVYLRAVRLLFNYLEDMDIIFMNPAENLIIPRVSRDIKHVPTENDIEKLLNQPDISTLEGIRDRAIIEILYSTGVRLDELVNLKIPDVDMKNNTARVIGKGDKERVVPFGKQAFFWIEKYISEVRPIFLKNDVEQSVFLGSKHGKKIHYLIVERLVHGYSKQAGVETISPHCLRRACATHMLQNGAHPVHIQMLLGHASLRVLSRYLKVSIKDLKKMHSERNPGK